MLMRRIEITGVPPFLEAVTMTASTKEALATPG
jgi:hypothetical protein